MLGFAALYKSVFDYNFYCFLSFDDAYLQRIPYTQ